MTGLIEARGVRTCLFQCSRPESLEKECEQHQTSERFPKHLQGTPLAKDQLVKGRDEGEEFVTFCTGTLVLASFCCSQ